MKFEEWLAAQGLSESTIRKYAGAIDGPLTLWGNQHSIINRPLRSINDFQEFAVFSELIEATDIFVERNSRGNHMYGAALNNYARYLTALALNAKSYAGKFGHALESIAADNASVPPFEPQSNEDGRARVLREVVRRQGQPQFRKRLIAAYGSRCAVTGCSLLVVLEAAHITPYLGPKSNHVSNGLLLRADIHTLWDLALIAIDPTTMELAVSSKLADATYQGLFGTQVYQPLDVVSRPSPAALKQQWELFHHAV